MKTLILYYSHSGNTEALAEKTARELNADIEEIIEADEIGTFEGVRRAMNRTKTPIQPLNAQLADYDKIIFMSPVWAGHPVSAVNTAIDLLPTGKQVEFTLVSGGSGTQNSAPGTQVLVTAKGCEVVNYSDVVVKVDKKTGEVSTKPVKIPDITSVVAIGAAIGVTVLAAVGVYKIYKRFK